MSRNKTNYSYKNVFLSYSFAVLTRLHVVTLNSSRWKFKSLLQISDFSHFLVLISVTNLSDYEGDLSFMDDDDIDEITYTNSNQNRKSLTGTSITSFSEDRRSISTLNQQNFEEIVKDDDGVFHFKEPKDICLNYQE